MLDPRALIRAEGAAMRDHERIMVAYARLAAASQHKRQPAGRDRFLVLTAAAACRAGWPEVAAACRRLVLENNPRHLVGRWETPAEALRSDEFPLFLRQLERTCNPEHAEYLLSQLAGDQAVPLAPAAGDDPGPAVLAMLGEGPLEPEPTDPL
jgi:hypothetical protein